MRRRDGAYNASSILTIASAARNPDIAVSKFCLVGSFAQPVAEFTASA